MALTQSQLLGEKVSYQLNENIFSKAQYHASATNRRYEIHHMKGFESL